MPINLGAFIDSAGLRSASFIVNSICRQIIADVSDAKYRGRTRRIKALMIKIC
jgi:hypothetical protein